MNDWLEIDLRPLRLGELLDRTFVLYRRRFALFAGILLVPQCILLAGQLLLEGFVNPIVGAKPGHLANPAASAAFLGMTYLLVFVYVFIYIFATGAVTCAISDVYLNRPITIRGAYAKLKGRIGSMIGLFCVLVLLAIALFIAAVFLAAILFAAVSLLGPTARGIAGFVVVLGVVVIVAWVFLHFALTVPVLVLERTGVFASLGRSFQLTRNLCGKIFVAWVLVLFLVYNALLLIQGPFLAAVFSYTFKGGPVPFWLAAVNAVAGSVSSILSGPFAVLIVALFYYDARVRKEALDIRLLLAEAEREAQPQPPSSSTPLAGAVLG